MDASMLLASGQYFNFMSPAGFRFDVEVIAHALSIRADSADIPKASTQWPNTRYWSART